MSEWIVTIVDQRGNKLAQFLTMGSRGRAKRAGYERAEMLPTARAVDVVRA
jgi:hypothetical protein